MQNGGHRTVIYSAHMAVGSEASRIGKLRERRMMMVASHSLRLRARCRPMRLTAADQSTGPGNLALCPGRIQRVVAARRFSICVRHASSASAGIFQSSAFRGRAFSVAATAAIVSGP